MKPRPMIWPSGFAVLCLLVAPGYVPADALGGQGLLVRYVSPLPDSRYILPGTNIIIRTDGPIGAEAASKLVGNITGNQSGRHRYSLRVSDDGQTVTFQPQTPFTASEVVSVEIDTTAARWTGPARAGGFAFTISANAQDLNVPWRRRGDDVPAAVSPQPRPGRKGFTIADSGVVLPNITVTVSKVTSPGTIFLSPNISSTDSVPSLLILRNDGSAVFARDLQANAFDFKPQPNGTLTYYDNVSSTFKVMDQTFTVVDSLQCGNGYITDIHDLRILPNGHALLMGQDPQVVDMSQIVPGGNPQAVVDGYIIQELDTSKTVVFQWRSWDHYQITDADHLDFTAPEIDYVHGNALDVDTDGNILFSSRLQNEITKIDRRTGAMIWRLGGKNNQFRFVNDSIGFSYQHAVRRIANGNITLFDNGNFHNPPFSRAVEYALDTARMTATLVWQYRDTPDVFGYALGFVERMPNGNTFIAWGAANPTVTEVTATGSKVYEMTLDPGVFTYRAFRYEWPPAVTSAPVRAAPATFTLSQNYPNPFNPATTVRFTLARQSPVSLEVFDLLGQRVATLVDGVRAAGSYSERFDGSRLASGVYVYRLRAGNLTATQKMLLIR